MTIRPVGAELFHADGQTNMTKVAFRNFTNERKKWSIYCALWFRPVRVIWGSYDSDVLRGREKETSGNYRRLAGWNATRNWDQQVRDFKSPVVYFCLLSSAVTNYTASTLESNMLLCCFARLEVTEGAYWTYRVACKTLDMSVVSSAFCTTLHV